MVQAQDTPTREKILEAAINLFSENGYSDITVREIAQAVGIKASSLYKHFECKEDILQSIFDLFQGKMRSTEFSREQLEEYVHSVSPEKYLYEAFELFKNVMWSPLTLKIAKIITMEQGRNRSVRQFFIQELIQKPTRTLQCVFEIMMERGVMERKDARILAEEYTAYVIFLYFEQNFLKETPDLPEIEQKMKQHNDFYAQYLLTRKEGYAL